MEDEISKRLAAAADGVAGLKKADSMLAELRGQKTDLAFKVSEYETKLAKENLDVEKLERGSLSALFYSVLGTIDERRDKELSEALAAKLKLDQAGKELEALNARINEIQRQREGLAGCEAEYARLYEQKKQALLGSHGSEAQSILELTEGINKAKADIKEICEAIAAGESSLAHLDGARQCLDKAHGWGTYDLLGGGLLADIVKHDHIDDATEEVSRAQIALNNFRTELADVRIQYPIEVQLSDFSRFADFFFDGLIADWYVQNRIEDSLQSVSSAGVQVSAQLSRLNLLKIREQQSLVRQQTELDTLILGASGGANQ